MYCAIPMRSHLYAHDHKNDRDDESDHDHDDGDATDRDHDDDDGNDDHHDHVETVPARDSDDMKGQTPSTSSFCALAI